MGVVLLLVALPSVVAMGLVLTLGGVPALVLTTMTVGLVIIMLFLARDWDRGEVDDRSMAPSAPAPGSGG